MASDILIWLQILMIVLSATVSVVVTLTSRRIKELADTIREFKNAVEAVRMDHEKRIRDLEFETRSCPIRIERAYELPR